jgi:hypothetical protein
MLLNLANTGASLSISKFIIIIIISGVVRGVANRSTQPQRVWQAQLPKQRLAREACRCLLRQLALLTPAQNYTSVSVKPAL